MNRQKPTVEQLEDRIVPKITFADLASGIKAYNTETNSWRNISTLHAKVMDEGADGTLFASFTGYGTYRYSYSTNHWTKLRDGAATVLSAGFDDTLFATFSSGNKGTFRYDGHWYNLTSALASSLACVRDRFCYGSFAVGAGTISPGTYRFDETVLRWLRISGAVAMAMDAQSTRLFVSFSTGTWMYTYATGGTWQVLTTLVAKDIADVSSSQFFCTFSNGTYSYNANTSSFKKITSTVATQIAADSSSFVYVKAGLGTFELDSSGITTKLTNGQATLLT